LPRIHFPEFCVTPANLVPCCSDCNKEKLDYVPDSYEKQIFHPYFDDWSGTVVLVARPVITDRVEVLFSIDSRAGETPKWIGRANQHFRLLNLGVLYAQHAAVEMVQRKRDFQTTYSVVGANGLKQELIVEANSRSSPFPNAWQPALYRGLAASEAFCAGGFEQIEE
jgi:hypothetical protein